MTKFGYKQSEEHKKKISNSLKNKPHTEEHNRHVSEGKRGKPRHNKPGTPGPMTGKKHSEETKKKMSEKRKGIKRDPIHIEKWIETRRNNGGWIVSNNQRAQISQTLTGIKQSEETKQKRAETLRKVYQEHPEIKERIVHNKEDHWNWQGGKSFEDYPSEFFEMRDYIRELHGNLCALCDKTPEENEEELSVHHIDYDKNNNKEENLVPLCRSCQLATNYNRAEWPQLFVKIKQEMSSRG